jgi:hypothetical protein
MGYWMRVIVSEMEHAYAEEIGLHHPVLMTTYHPGLRDLPESSGAEDMTISCDWPAQRANGSIMWGKRSLQELVRL